MHKRKLWGWLALAGMMAALCLSIPGAAFAHEVYVLSPQEIQIAIHTPSVPIMSVIREHLAEFIQWAVFGAVVVLAVFFISIIPALTRRASPFFAKTKPWGPVISRVTMGVSFLAAAYYQASYGPELPLAGIYGAWAPLATAVLVVIGVLIIIDKWVRPAALVALAMFAVTVWFHGWYMLTYANYLGEIVVLLMLGAGVHAAKEKVSRSFAILRVLFGTALIYASFYAKILYANLALDTVNQYHLTNYLHFTPHFLVLGAAIVEISIGLFFILGIEIRFVSLFFLFWLTLSLVFFGEVVWPHLILIGIPIAFFFYGYDRYSLEGYFFARDGREPVL